MISLASRSFRICDRPSPIFGLILHPNSISGIRYASLTHAIERGKRASLSAEDRSRNRRSDRSGARLRGTSDSRESKGRERDLKFVAERTNDKYPPKKFDRQRGQATPRSRSQAPKFELDTAEFIRTGKFTPKEQNDRDEKFEDFQPENFGKEPSWMQRGRHDHSALKKKSKNRKSHKYSDEFPVRVKEHVKVPSSIPYTTAASEFIYGASAVESALRCSRRKFYKLYIHQGQGEALTTQQSLIRKMALAQGIAVKLAFGEWEALMDKMSGGRPHNSFVLEASPLPQLPIAYLEPVTDPAANVFNVKLSPQSEEEAKVNGTSNEVERLPRYDEASQSRFPLMLLVDGIVDPGNMGAIIRSAYYLGVDGIVYAGRNSAPINPVTSKASAGATENMTLFRTSNPQEFIQASRKNGWRFLAADSPSNVFERSGDVVSVDRAAGTNTPSLLLEAPTVLMLGNEGTGLMERLKVRADGLISIPGARFNHGQGVKDAAGVDSLNVSVAAAMLMEMLMRTPLQLTDIPQAEKEQKETLPSSETRTPEVAPQSFDFN